MALYTVGVSRDWDGLLHGAGFHTVDCDINPTNFPFEPRDEESVLIELLPLDEVDVNGLVEQETPSCKGATIFHVLGMIREYSEYMKGNRIAFLGSIRQTSDDIHCFCPMVTHDEGILRLEKGSLCSLSEWGFHIPNPDLVAVITN